jgi:hypothetical protein
MSSQTKKIIYQDNNRDVAITGEIIAEDDHFLTVLGEYGREYRIGKRFVVCIKNRDEGFR